MRDRLDDAFYALRRPLVLVVVIVVVLLIAGGLTFFFVYGNHVRQQQRKDYRATVKADWDKLVAQARDTAVAAARAESPAALQSVNTAVEKMLSTVDKVEAQRAAKGPPPGYAATAQSEKQALESLKHYLQVLNSASSARDPQTLAAQIPGLDGAARQARSNLTDFYSSATWLQSSFPGDVFGVRDSLVTLFNGPAQGNPQEREAVYSTLDAFQQAAIKKFNIDTVWSLLGGNIRLTLDTNKITKDVLAGRFSGAWRGEKPPSDYYISRQSINFTPDGKAHVTVINYDPDGVPDIGEVVLVKEADGWKIDTYPFINWQ